MILKEEKLDYIICGGGASGLLLLKALNQDAYFSDKKILLIESNPKNSNDRTWSFWEESKGSFDGLLTKKWDEALFIGPNNKHVFGLAPTNIRCSALLLFMKNTSQKKQT